MGQGPSGLGTLSRTKLEPLLANHTVREADVSSILDMLDMPDMVDCPSSCRKYHENRSS